MDLYMGTILAFGFQFNPQSCQYCQGQTLNISQYSAMFALLGTYYGGNGQTTFNLPDLRGRMAIGQGNGPGLTSRTIGNNGGAEHVTLGIANMPMHNHTATGSVTVNVSNNTANNAVVPSASNNVLAGTPSSGPTSAAIWGASTLTPNIPLGGVSGSAITIGNTGGNSPTQIMNPFLVLNFCIVMEGLFPSRN